MTSDREFMRDLIGAAKAKAADEASRELRRKEAARIAWLQNAALLQSHVQGLIEVAVEELRQQGIEAHCWHSRSPPGEMRSIEDPDDWEEVARYSPAVYLELSSGAVVMSFVFDGRFLTGVIDEPAYERFASVPIHDAKLVVAKVLARGIEIHLLDELDA